MVSKCNPLAYREVSINIKYIKEEAVGNFNF
jgi:hypothetical protein